jgi:Bacterial antitoxin of type II TA system, VapB
LFCEAAQETRLFAKGESISDKHLIEEGRRLGEHKTALEAITAALEEYVRHRRQLRILELFGTVDFDPNNDYKAERRKKRC